MESLKISTGVRSRDFTITNADRSIGAELSGELSRRYGAIMGRSGLSRSAPLQLRFNGVAGQSFGAFLTSGVSFQLQGEANDYVGKGLSGGTISIDCGASASLRRDVLAGNTVLYGATSGELYVSGRAGERFAVRNSGALAVVEGVGQHGCEYMTGGTVVVIGATGRNFAAGMSGGIAYVYDPDGDFEARCNTSMVTLEPVLTVKEQEAQSETWHVQHKDGLPEADEVILKRLIERHFKHTGSTRARFLLDDWATARAKFVKVFPNEYKRALIEMAADAAMEVEAVAA